MKSFDEMTRSLNNAIDRYKDKMVGVGEIRIDYMAEDCLMFIKEQQKEIEELKAKQRWIPVSERLPESYKPVLVQSKYEEIDIDYTDDEGGFHDPFSYSPIIAWQSLPEPYKEEN